MHKGFQYANIPLEKHGNETREYNRTGGYNSMGTGLGTTVWEQDWWVQQYGNRTGGYNSMGTGLITTVWEQDWWVQQYGNRVGVRHFVSCLHSSASIDSSFISCVNIHNMSTLGGRL